MLAGRDAERARIASVVDAARAGSGSALVVRGVAGTGKSALLADIVAGVGADMSVLRTSGVESESPLAFAALQRLLRPLRKSIDALPAPQRAAMGAAFGEASGDGDRFLAFLATLSLLADAAEQQPVLVVVDDAHWLDDASAAALLFVARRLQAERVAILFAAREGDAREFDAADLPALTLVGLDQAAAAGLLSSGGREVDTRVCDELVAATAGNPLALAELAGTLSAAQLAGLTPLPDPLPVTGGVERAFLHRYHQLADDAQRMLLVAAADDTARLPVVRDAADRLGIGDDAFDAVERTGLLRVDGDVVALYHPLVRSAVYRAATSAQRRATHQALADALSGDADRRAWHLAAAVDRPDETVVAALDAVADRAVARAGHEGAAAAWARAAELTVDTGPRARRLYSAAQSSWLGGHPVRAAALARSADLDATDPLLRVQVLLLRGQIEWNTTSLNDGYEFVVAAATTAAAVDELTARQLAMLAASLSAWGARGAGDVDPATLLPRPGADASAQVLLLTHLMDGFTAVTAGEWAAAAAAFEHAFAMIDGHAGPVDHVVQPNLGIATMHMDDDARGLRLHDEQLTGARRAGALSMIDHALTRGFHFQLATGAWSAAASAAAEALTLSTSTGQTGLTALPTAELAVVTALRGDTTAADAHLAEVARVRKEHKIGITDALVADLEHWGHALGAMRQPAAALGYLEQITLPHMRRLAAVDRVETAVRADRPDLARAWQAEIQEFADATGIASAIAVAEHAAAVLADPADADEHFTQALAAHERSPRIPDRARTELAYGEHLRRSRRRVDAREHLRTALNLFENLGATSYADRAAQELRASGETARRRDVTTTTALTAQERQVATLVRQGLSNRDAAAQLFLSPRTVDFHLRNVFTKLGVSSRGELANVSLD